MFALPLLFATAAPMPIYANEVLEPKMPTMSVEIAPLSPTFAVPAPARSAVPLNDSLLRVLELTNIQREQAGLHPLRLNTRLTAAAAWMANDMAENDYFGHQDREGRRVGDRAFEFGYRAYTVVGENMAAGIDCADAAVLEWMTSPSHRRNLMRPEFTEIGLGFASSPSGQYKTYWVQTFGSRPDYVASRWK